MAIKKPMRISMQYFAENNTNAAGQGGSPSQSAGQQNQTESFDDILKKDGMQSEFDKRISKALETAKTKWDLEAKAKLSEAQKLAEMDAQQKAQYERDKKDQALAEREAAVTRRELMAEARSQLSEKGLPQELAEVLNYSDADTAKKSMDEIVKAFGKAVEKAVNDKLRGTPPKAGAGNTNQPVGDGSQRRLI